MTTDQQDRTDADRRWVWAFAAFVMVITTVPYLVARNAAATDWQFTGFLFGVDDGNSYIAKMLRGATGDWLFRTPYTPFPQRGVLAFLPYLVLGKLVSPNGTHLQLVVGFHAFRLVAGFLAILATHDFLRLFLRRTSTRRLGLALAVLGGGLGWVLLLAGRDQWLGSLPLEYFSPESFGFLSLYGLPHLALARALLLWSLVVYLGPIPDENRAPAADGAGTTHRSLRWWYFRSSPAALRAAIKTGLFWLLLGLAQPLTVLVAWAVVSAHLALGALLARTADESHRRALSDAWWSRLRTAAGAMLISSPLVAYTALSFSLDPFLRLWTDQNLILSPHPAHYLLAFGLVLPLAIFGLVKVVTDRSWHAGLLASWVCLFPFLAYAPYNLQRRLPEGIWVALVGLAMLALERLASVGKARLAALPLAMVFPSTLILLAGGILTARLPAPPVFRPADEVAIFELLAEQASPNTVVLSSFESGNPLPAWAPLRVVIGHGPESVNLADLQPQVHEFFGADTPDSDRLALMDRLDVRYVLWGPAERKLGDWDPRTASFLKHLSQRGEFSVFELRIE